MYNWGAMPRLEYLEVRRSASQLTNRNYDNGREPFSSAVVWKRIVSGSLRSWRAADIPWRTSREAKQADTSIAFFSLSVLLALSSIPRYFIFSPCKRSNLYLQTGKLSRFCFQFCELGSTGPILVSGGRKRSVLSCRRGFDKLSRAKKFQSRVTGLDTQLTKKCRTSGSVLIGR